MFHVLSFQIYLYRALIGSVSFFLFFIFLSNLSLASSISNFGQWKNLNSISKTIYTAGMLDTFVTPLDPTISQTDLSEKLSLCLETFKLSIPEVAKLVDNFYLNPENWKLKPQDAVMYKLMNGQCFQFFN